MSNTTLPGLLLKGVAASRPAANAVGGGALYSATDTGAITQSDGVSTWSAWATITAGSGSITASGYTMTTARLLGRTTASTGAVEEITVGSGLSLSAGALTATGGAAGAMVFLEAHTASTSATLDFTTFISSTYDTYVFQFLNLLPSTNTDLPWIRVGTGGGPTYDTGSNYGWQVINSGFGTTNAFGSAGSTADTKIALFNGGQSSSFPFSGTMMLWDPQNAAARKNMAYTGPIVFSTGPVQYFVQMQGVYQTNTAITAIRFMYSSGNIASGTIRVYGIAKS